MPPPAFLALVRHAQALRALPGQPDSDRALSEFGVEQFRRQCARLRDLGLRFDAVRSSPWRRALETARLLNGSDGPGVETHLGLCSELDAAAARELRASLHSESALEATPRRVAWIGHEPWISAWARSLGARGLREFETGQVVILEPDSNGAWRVWRNLEAAAPAL